MPAMRAFKFFIPVFILHCISDLSNAEFQAEYLLVDCGYGTDAIIRDALQIGMTPVISPKKNRKILRDYDKHIYKLRHIVKNAFFAPQKVARYSYLLR